MALHPGSLEAILRRCGAWNESLMVCLDFGDPRCVPDNNQLIFDLSPERHIFTRGLTVAASEASDPTYVSGPAGHFRPATNTTDFTGPAHFSFDGGDIIICQANSPAQRWSKIPSEEPCGAAVGVSNAWSCLAVYAVPALGSATHLLGTSLASAADERISMRINTSEAPQLHIDGGPAGNTITISSLTTGALNTWMFSSAAVVAGKQTVLHRGVQGTNTDANTASMANDGGTRMTIGGQVTEAAPTTITLPLPATSRVMLCAIWGNWYMEHQIQVAIRNELRAWRVNGLE